MANRRKVLERNTDVPPARPGERALFVTHFRDGLSYTAPTSMQTLLKFRFRIVFLGLLLASLILLAAFWFQRHEDAHASSRGSTSSNRLAQLPPTILWAWERPERLEFIDLEKVGVAFLARTIYLRGDRAVSRPRLQTLTLPPGARIVAVARIESEHSTDYSRQPALSPAQIAETAATISELGSLPNVVMVQVDFDATTSERPFYRELLNQLRRKLPPSTALSITALASWCKGDNWLDDLPVDEAVPMLFRMGIERKQFLSELSAGEPFASSLCRSSAGVSTDEPLAQVPRVQRLYVFNPRVWSPDALNKTMEAYQR